MIAPFRLRFKKANPGASRDDIEITVKAAGDARVAKFLANRKKEYE